MPSRLASIAGLTCLAAGVAFMFGTGPTNATVFYWERLLLGCLGCVGFFMLAVRLHK